jgi:2-oxoisovalerate dehydrogenase E1 component beta subunit
MVIRAPYGGGIGGGLYHSQSVEAFFAHVPGLKVVIPSTPYDAKGLLKAAIRDEDPVLFFEHKKTYRLIKGEVPGDDYTVPIGPADIKRAGDDMSVFAYGLMLKHCLDAAEEMAREGVSIEVVDLRTLAPLDKETIDDRELGEKDEQGTHRLRGQLDHGYGGRGGRHHRGRSV